MKMLYYYKDNVEENAIECFRILIDVKKLESIRIRIIEKYFQLNHYEFDTTYDGAQVCIKSKNDYKNFNCTTLSCDGKIFYHISYDKCVIPRIAQLIAKLCIDEDTSVIDELFSFNSFFKENKINDITSKLENVDAYSYCDKTKYLEQVQKIIKKQELEQNNMSINEEQLYFEIQSCIQFFPIFKLMLNEQMDTLENYKILEEVLIKYLDKIYMEDIRDSVDKKIRHYYDKIIRKRKIIK